MLSVCIGGRGKEIMYVLGMLFSKPEIGTDSKTFTTNKFLLLHTEVGYIIR